jgi:hypothetical protein
MVSTEVTLGKVPSAVNPAQALGVSPLVPPPAQAGYVRTVQSGYTF